MINDISRILQLSDGGARKFSAIETDLPFTFTNLKEEISRGIDALSPEGYEQGMRWYSEACEFAWQTADEFGTTAEIVAGVVSAVSPRMPWVRNKAVARELLSRYRDFSTLTASEAATRMGLGLVSNFSLGVRIARGEEIGEILSGTKRRSFYNNIIAPTKGDSVTIDTWMCRAIMAVDPVATLKSAQGLLTQSQHALGGTGFGYYLLAETCREVASQRRIRPCQVQAMYWIYASGSADGGSSA